MQLVYLFIMMRLIWKTYVEYLKDYENVENVPPTIRDIEQFEKDNPGISITIFEYGGFHKIKEDDNNNENTKEGIVIKDVRVSPYALKRKHLVELLIIKDKETAHFTTMKSVSRLLHGSKYDKRLHYCKNCYCSFMSEEKLNSKHTLMPKCWKCFNNNAWKK